MELVVKNTYKGGAYDDGLSEIYDGAKSLNGFSRAISIVTHAFLNEEVIQRSTAMKGAVIYRKASKKGSFVELFVVVIENPVVQGITAAAFYDMLKFSFDCVLGKEYEPETSRVRKIVDRKEPIIPQLMESLEEPLKEMHRPIITNPSVTIDVERSRSALVRMDSSTKDYLYNDVVSDFHENVVGNVTKFNMLTGYGRMFIDSLGKTFSFKIDDFITSADRFLMTWSLDEAYRVQGGGKLSMTVKYVESGDGIVKRVIVYKVAKA